MVIWAAAGCCRERSANSVKRSLYSRRHFYAVTALRNGIADVLARLPDYPANKVADLLPWNWKPNLEPKAAVAA
jgi:hypothetical protein